MARRHYDLNATPQNFRTIWDKLHDLAEQAAAQQATIAAQQATITTQQGLLARVKDQATQALITAGKNTGTSPTNSGTGAGGGGTPPSHDSQYAVVVAAIADLVAAGEDLSGPCGSFKVTNQVVINLRPSQPDVGLINKPGGNQCNGYSTDALMYLDGAVYDLLIDAENAPPSGAAPQWSYAGQRPPTDWRDPV